MTSYCLALLVLSATLVACGGGDGDRSGPPMEAGTASAKKAPAEEQPARTNVLLITIDTLRADALGAYGQAKLVSPHIDAFASEGVLFEDCVSSSPSTLPSHASIFTGRHPYAHGVRSNSGYVLGESELTLAEILRQHGYRTRAEIASEVLRAATRIDQGFDAVHSVDADDVELMKLGLMHAGGQPHQRAEQRAGFLAREGADITRHGIRFLETAKASESPFFLWLHYFDPHIPYAAPERFADRLPEDPYLADVAYADHSIGDVLTSLIRLELSDNTLVVITSDHGEGLGEHGEMAHAAFLYNSTIQVPLIMRGPGLGKGKRIASPVRTIDIAPTILALLDLPPLENSQGVSLRGMMNGNELPALTSYGESIMLLEIFGSPVLRFARRGRWKYIHTAPPELYDVASDPAELDNLAAREPERTAELRATLTALLSGAGRAEASSVEVDAESQAHLEALGYIVGSPAPREILDSLELADSLEGHSPADDIALLASAKENAARGSYEVAAGHVRELRTRYPHSPNLLRLLVEALHDSEQATITSRSEVAALLAEALEFDGDNVERLVQLARLSARVGDLPQAISTLQLALEVDRCSSWPRATLLDLLHTAKRYREHFEAARQGVLQCPELPSTLNDMAWIFATSPVDALRDGEQAIELAKRALALEPDNIGFRDTLAAAYAEAGEYGRAQGVMATLVRELEARGAPPQGISIFQSHQAEFAAGRPLRE